METGRERDRLDNVSMTGSLVDTKADVVTDSGDKDKFAHYAEKDQITEALVFGIPIVALCGKVWVPSRDPSKFPICKDCKRLHDALYIAD